MRTKVSLLPLNYYVLEQFWGDLEELSRAYIGHRASDEQVRVPSSMRVSLLAIANKLQDARVRFSKRTGYDFRALKREE